MNRITDREKKMLLESWGRNIEAVSRRKKCTDVDKVHFARVLENTRRQMEEAGLRSMNEDAVRSGVTQMSNVTRFPDTILYMVSALYASQIAEQLVSVQPLEHPQGYAVYLQYLYGDQRGDNFAGDPMIDQWGGFRNMENRTRYSSPFIEGEPVANGTTVNVSGSLQNIPVIFDADTPIIFEDMSGTSSKWKLSKTGSKSYSLMALDANGFTTGAELLKPGTCDVNPDTGVFSFETTSVLSPDGLRVHYTQDLSSGPTKAGRVTLNLKTEPILAIPHKLRAQYTMDAGYSISKSYGINIEESLIAACTAEIRQERDSKIIDILCKQAGSTSTWKSTPSVYYSKREYDEAFISELFACTTQIQQKTLRVRGNWVVVGKQGIDILNSVGLPRFQPSTVDSPNGPYLAGKLDGRLDVFYSPYVDTDQYLVGYKGPEFYDSGFILGDYLPIASTDFLMLDDFVGRKGFVSYYGTKMLNPDMYVSGKIINT